MLWTLGIFILLSLPGEEFPESPGVPFIDKFIHAILCGVHVWLWSLFLNTRLRNKANRNKLFFLVFLITCIYGILMEYYQKFFVPNRSFEYEDMVADVVGAAIGWLISRRFIR